MFEINGKYTTARIMIDDVEESCISQIVQVTNHPAFTNPIAIMPDTHAGKGCVIGFTMELGDKLIPNIIGLDLGCGMLSFKIGNKLFDNITREELDIEIRKRVPFGSSVREKAHECAKFGWEKINEEIRLFTLKFNKHQKYLGLKSKCKSVGIIDDEIFQLIYENVFESGEHKLSDNIINRLERI